MSKKRTVLWIFILAMCMVPGMLMGQCFADGTMTWDASTGTVDGYRIYYGTASGDYTLSKDVGNVTTYAVDDLTGIKKDTLYYFVVRAYNRIDESGNSNEVSFHYEEVTEAPGLPGELKITKGPAGN